MSQAPFTVLYTREAERNVRRLDPAVRILVRRAIEGLALAPERGKPLSHALAGLRSLRTADYRIVYRVRDEQLIIIVITEGHRRDIYRKLKELLEESGKK